MTPPANATELRAALLDALDAAGFTVFDIEQHAHAPRLWFASIYTLPYADADAACLKATRRLCRQMIPAVAEPEERRADVTRVRVEVLG